MEWRGGAVVRVCIRPTVLVFASEETVIVVSRDVERTNAGKQPVLLISMNTFQEYFSGYLFIGNFSPQRRSSIYCTCTTLVGRATTGSVD